METRGSIIIAATVVGMLILVVGYNPEAMVGANTAGPSTQQSEVPVLDGDLNLTHQTSGGQAK